MSRNEFTGRNDAWQSAGLAAQLFEAAAAVRAQDRRSFILGIRSESDDAPIVTSIISMAHRLNLRVVMEGIETGAPVVFYRERSCEYLGFLFSKPVPGVEFASRLKVQARG